MCKVAIKVIKFMNIKQLSHHIMIFMAIQRYSWLMFECLSHDEVLYKQGLQWECGWHSVTVSHSVIRLWSWGADITAPRVKLLTVANKPHHKER